MLNCLNNLLAINIDGESILKTFMFLVLGMVLMFIVMTVLYFAIRLLNLTDKHNDSIKAFFVKIGDFFARLFGKKDK